MSILNLTQHAATLEQIAQDVVEPDTESKLAIQRASTFDALPNNATLKTRAETLAIYAAGTGHKSAMIGGAPFFMASLEEALWRHGVRLLYAFSIRENEDQAQPDGSVRKVNVFRHVGFVGTEFAELAP